MGRRTRYTELWHSEDFLYYLSFNLRRVSTLAAHVAKRPSFGSFNFLTVRGQTANE